MKKEAINTFETLESTYHTVTRRHNPEDRDMRVQRQELERINQQLSWEATPVCLMAGLSGAGSRNCRDK
jgi:hypothetical protein